MNLFSKLFPYDPERTTKNTLFIFGLGLLILLNSIRLININQYALMAICIGCFMCSSYKECKYLLFFLMPLVCALNGFVISIGVLLLYIKCTHKIFRNILPFLFVFLIEFVHFLLAEHFAIVDFTYYISFLFTFFYLLSDGDTLSSPRYCTKMFCYGLMVALFVVIYGMINTYGVYAAFSGLFRDGLIIGSSDDNRAVGVTLNANSVAYYSLALISILLSLYMYIKMSRFLIVFGVTIGILAGIISFSRTWLLLIALFVMIFFLLASQRKYIIILIGFLILILPTFTIFSSISSGFSDRFTDDDIETAGNRKQISRNLFEYMNNNPGTFIWGTGVITYKENTKQHNSPHNAILQVLVCTGGIGVLAFLFSIKVFLINNYEKKRGFLQYLPFLICFLDVQTIQFLSPYFLMFPLLASMYCMKTNVK